MIIGWENIENLEDYFITYLLYKNSLSLDQICRIRNKSLEDINSDLIRAKLEIREMNKELKSPSRMEEYLYFSKEKRLKYLSKMEKSDLFIFKKEIYHGLLHLKNIDDLMVLVWTVGELRDEDFLKLLYPLTEKNHSNMRRLAYSAIGKIGKPESSYILELGLMDDNPQVRQYCAKYLGNIGSIDSIRILENIVKNKSGFEKEYVIRACRESLRSLYSKFKTGYRAT